MTDETWLGLSIQEWSGLLVAMTVVAVVMWFTSTEPVETKLVSILLGAVGALALGVVAFRVFGGD